MLQQILMFLSAACLSKWAMPVPAGEPCNSAWWWRAGALFGCLFVVTVVPGCAGKTTKPDVPRGIIVQPKLVEVVRTEYVRVPAELTDPLPIAEGPLSLCPLVAADRRKTIEKANADRRATRALSGTEARK